MTIETAKEDTQYVNISKKDIGWVDDETMCSSFKDARLQNRFRILLEQIWNSIGGAIPFACQDWANTKAAYRFLSNDKVSEKEILEGHFVATAERVNKQKEGKILILHDTTEFIYHSKNPEKIGFTTNIQTGKNMLGKPILYKQCGILMHSSLAITDAGLPLGLCAIKFWNRKIFKDTNKLKKHINPTRVDIKEKESYRWLESLSESTNRLKEAGRCIHIGDRESDIYELFALSKDYNTHFITRLCHNRSIDSKGCDVEFIDNKSHTIADAMELIKVKGSHTISIPDANSKMVEIELEMKYTKITILPPAGPKRKKYSPLALTVIYAVEKEIPDNRERIFWKLITDLDITSQEEAIEKLDWYSLRWKIETFHKILKSGCKAESLKLRTAERLNKMIAIFCIVSWRIFWMTIIGRLSPNAPPEVALTKEEIQLIDRLNNKDKLLGNSKTETLSYYLNKIAILGGYMNRTSDPPPGNIIMWRGLSRLSDMRLGLRIGVEMTCG
jgi:hypothetical protein